MPELQAQLEAVKKLHDTDVAAGFAGVFLDDQLEKKYPRAAKELVWQPRNFASQASAKAGCAVVHGRSLMIFGARWLLLKEAPLVFSAGVADLHLSDKGIAAIPSS